MLCERCHERQATLHVKTILNGQVSEANLCEVCAQETGAFKNDFMPTMDISEFLGSFFNAPKVQRTKEEVHCQTCGMTYEQFAEHGKLGCGACYGTFYDALQYPLKKIHGNTLHVGKVPRRGGGALKFKRQLEELKLHLLRAVQKEEYETAAQIRDQIKQLEQKKVEGSEV